MCSSKNSRRTHRPSIMLKSNNNNNNKVEEENTCSSNSITDFELKKYGLSNHLEKRKQCNSSSSSSSLNAELKNQPEWFTTSELISAFGQLWNRYSCGSQSNDLVTEDLRLQDLEKDVGAGSYFCVDVGSESSIAASVQLKLELLTVTQKLSVFEPCRRDFTCPLVSQFSKGSCEYSNEYWRRFRLASLGISSDMGRVYTRMKSIIPARSHYNFKIARFTEDEKTDKICLSGSTINHAEGCIPRDENHAGNNVASRKIESLDDNTKVGPKTETISSLCSDYFLQDLCDNNVAVSNVRVPSSTLCMDYHINKLVPHRSPHGTFQHNIDNIMDENTRKQPYKFVAGDDNSMGLHPSAFERPRNCLATQQHAYAGAFAGIFVSLCLHPVDTIKTVTQSYHVQQKSLCEIGRSIIYERGVTGLYRGISSNIASSAPISAIYTFTYESVKGSLLPLFTKEYHSLAHCVAGGSASIATSFVFTPSERIKQQMQIGSRYHNCWNALIGIIGNGGLPSLYTGWGAVLCRNVPHSIIKFYTYESLKKLMLPSQNSTAQPNTLQTVVCGGLAGSTAALFTTPFDVVKTRLQIQIPGSMSQYTSVFHALKEISKHEGLKGLYRGLFPRLFMYVSQGALFFASYEFFKRLFSVQVSQFGAEGSLCKEHVADDLA